MHLNATEEWYRRYAEAVYRRCQRVVKDETLAWDLTQDVFVKAHRAAHEFRGDGSILTWLLTIADRTCFSALRGGKVRLKATEQLRGEHSEHDMSDEDLERVLVASDLLTHVLTDLDDDVQQILTLRYIDELEHEEIAARLNISRKTVYRKLLSGLTLARAALGHGSGAKT